MMRPVHHPFTGVGRTLLAQSNLVRRVAQRLDAHIVSTFAKHRSGAAEDWHALTQPWSAPLPKACNKRLAVLSVARQVIAGVRCV